MDKPLTIIGGMVLRQMRLVAPIFLEDSPGCTAPIVNLITKQRRLGIDKDEDRWLVVRVTEFSHHVA